MKMDGWKTFSFPLGMAHFQVRTVSFGEGRSFSSWWFLNDPIEKYIRKSDRIISPKLETISKLGLREVGGTIWRINMSLKKHLGGVDARVYG